MKNAKFKISVKNIIIIISMLISIISVATLIVIDFGKYTKEITITLNDKDKIFQISEITIGGSEFSLKELEDINLKYNEEYNFLYSNTGIAKYTLKTSALKDVKITFIENEANGNVIIEEKINGESNTIEMNTNSKIIGFNTYVSSMTIKEILYKSIIEFTYKEICICILLFILFSTLYTLALKKLLNIIRKMNNKNLNIKDSFILIFLLFFIMLGNIFLLLEILNIFIIIPILLIIIILFRKYPNIYKNPERIFLVFATITGMSFLFIHPQFNVPDEQAHYLKAYQIANNLKVEKQDSIDASVQVPKSISDTIYNYTMDLHSIDFKISAKTLLADYNTNFSSNTKSVTKWFGNVTSLPILCYIPSAIMIKACKLLDAPVILSIILSRFVNLSIFILIVYKAITIIPKFKNVLMIIGLLPITLTQAAAINQDSFTNAIFIFLLSYILKLIFEDKKITIKNIFPLYIGGLLLSFCKLVYFPILCLMFLIPYKNFDNKRSKYIHILVIISINIIFTLINILSVQNTSLNQEYFSIMTILTQPLYTIKVVLFTIFERFQLDMLSGVINGFGYSTKWGKNLCAFIMQAMFLILFLTANNNEVKEKKLTKNIRITILIIATIIFGLIYASLLTCCTTVETTMIQGLQSRYFIPVIALFLIGISNNKLTLNVKRKNLFYVICFSISIVISLFTIIYGFYV